MKTPDPLVEMAAGSGMRLHCLLIRSQVIDRQGELSQPVANPRHRRDV